MNSASLDPLLDELLMLTLSLEKIVLDEASEPEEWIELLNKRQEIMDSLSKLFAQGVSLTDAQKKTYLQPAYEVDLRIAPSMDHKKQKLESEMANLRKSKAVNLQYGGYNNSSPYGAFFDTKQ